MKVTLRLLAASALLLFTFGLAACSSTQSANNNGHDQYTGIDRSQAPANASVGNGAYGESP